MVFEEVARFNSSGRTRCDQAALPDHPQAVHSSTSSITWVV
jgi:hypothetical protein